MAPENVLLKAKICFSDKIYLLRKSLVPTLASVFQKQRWKLLKCTDMEPKYILLKPKLYFSNNILLFGNFAATALMLEELYEM